MIFTFYSFKGGVGRSMALASVANLFAERGLRVLAIDFDLEAPGLERFYFEKDEARRVRTRPGLLDLFLTYKLALTSETEFKRAAFREWRAFVNDAIPATTGGGSVHLMTAGCREPEEKLRSYALAVRTFDWQDFVRHWNGAQFFAWLREQLTDKESGYDVVLIDSRTGVTEMGGVCTYQLADAVVMLCAANYQNLDGTLAVARDFRSTAVLALRGGRPLEILAIPARLEDSHPDRDRFLQDFERTLTSEGLPRVLAGAGLDYRKLALPYNAAYALGDHLVGEGLPAEGESESLHEFRAVFGRLADALTLLAPEGKLSEQHEQTLQRLRGAAAPAAPMPIADVTQRGAGVDVFIDHSSEDQPAADALAEVLRSAGHLTFRADARSMAVGADWKDELIRYLGYCDSLIVLIGSGSPSASRDVLIRKARERGRPTIVPVLLGAGTSSTVLSSYGLDANQAIRLEDPGSPQFEHRARELATQLVTRQAEARTPIEDVDPYPGARAFREDDQLWFFGRESDLAALHASLQSHNVIVLRGRSGIGKTSLIQAGLIPMLRAETVQGLWQIETIDLSEEAAERALEVSVLDGGGTDRRLLILDGLDSFPRNGNATTRHRRFEHVRTAVGSAASTHRVILCVRGSWTEEEERLVLDPDSFERAAIHELEALAHASMVDAIRRPAERHRHLFEAGLIDRLINDAGAAASAMSLIQLALPILWQERRRGWLTNQAYDRSSGIAGVVRARKEALFKRLADTDKYRASLLFSNLVFLDSTLRLVPKQSAWTPLESIEALGPDAVALRDTLAAERLIVITRSPPTEMRPAAERAAVECALSANDASPYLDMNGIAADFMLWRERFRTYVLFWRDNAGGPDALVKGAVLAEADHWLSQRGPGSSLPTSAR